MKRLAILFFCLFALPQALTAGPAKTLSQADRSRISQTLTRIVAREVPGAGTRITHVRIKGRRMELTANIGLSYYPFRPESVAAIYDSVREALPEPMRRYKLTLLTDGRPIGELVPLAFRTPNDRRRVRPFTNEAARPLVRRLDAPYRPDKGLADRHIALWQSHGRYFDQRENRWRWQRTCQWMTCEDLYTQSYVLPFLVPMLENAGAVVLLPRERDVQPVEVVVDNDPGIDARGTYAELEGLQPWRDAGTGFAHRRGVYRSGENPFGEGTARAVRTIGEGEAESRAVWSAELPESGEYALYVSYKTRDDSADDARYTVRHRGGESRFAVNQTMGGGTWVYLGTFPLAAGRNEAVVTLTNRSDRAGAVVTADAVKIGGGYGNIARTVCDSLRSPEGRYAEETSGYPRFCEGARYWLQWSGFPRAVYTPQEDTNDYKDDYMSRAHWVNALVGGSERLPDSIGLGVPIDLALAFHSDSGTRLGDETIGTLGIFFTQERDGRFAGGADRYRSRDLTDAVMSQIVSDIRRSCEPQWRRRALWNRSYYEARVPAVPTMLLELLSHQNFTDMRYGTDPRFKFLVSRAVYKGILRHVAAQYDRPFVVQPLPVDGFSAVFYRDCDDQVLLRWRPVADTLEPTARPTGYVVYTRIGDGGFDGGRLVEADSCLVRQKQGVVYSYRVSAVNEGGESFPSEILTACRVPDQKGMVLVVNGFDRVSGPLCEASDSLAAFRCDLDAGVPYLRDIAYIGPQRVFDRSRHADTDMGTALGACDNGLETEVIGGNTFDYPALHGASIIRAGYSFCSTSARAVERGTVRLTDYRIVDLILGKQRTVPLGRGFAAPAFPTFPPALQRALEAFVEQGGALMVSGSYVASDSWYGTDASAADREFTRRVLGIEPDGQPASRNGRVRMVAPGRVFTPFAYRYRTEPEAEGYCVESTDALLPAVDGAYVAMRFADGAAAAVADERAGKRFVMAFPFETIRQEEARDRLMREVLRFLEPPK